MRDTFAVSVLIFAVVVMVNVASTNVALAAPTRAPTRAPAPMTTMQMLGPDFVLVVCDDIAFTHYNEAKVGKDGRPHEANDFVMSCPRSKPEWSLTFRGCPTHSVVSGGKASTYAFTC